MYTIMLMTLSLSATAEIPDGSLLVLRNSNKPVARFTGSDVTHVAMIFHHGETEWVYEATPAKARRLKLADYKRELGEGKPGSGRVSGVSLLKPKSPYRESQIERMRSHAASKKSSMEFIARILSPPRLRPVVDFSLIKSTPSVRANLSQASAIRTRHPCSSPLRRIRRMTHGASEVGPHGSTMEPGAAGHLTRLGLSVGKWHSKTYQCKKYS